MPRSIEKWGSDTEKSPVMNIIWGIVIFLIVSVCIDWFVQGSNFFMYKFFAPKQEAVRREVYEQTKSYKQGSIQRLGTLCSQIATADSAHAPMLNDIITQEFVEWDTTAVPQHLRKCLNTARAH
jgi:hypothetical protein